MIFDMIVKNRSGFHYLIPFQVIDTSLVDDTPWYTVVITAEVLIWIQDSFPENLWYSVGEPSSFGIIVDVPEHLFVMMELRWG